MTIYKDDAEPEKQEDEDSEPVKEEEGSVPEKEHDIRASSPVDVAPSAPQHDLSSDGSGADDDKEDDSTASIKSDN